MSSNYTLTLTEYERVLVWSALKYHSNQRNFGETVDLLNRLNYLEPGDS